MNGLRTGARLRRLWQFWPIHVSGVIMALLAIAAPGPACADTPPQPSLPSMRFLSAPPVSPTDAEAAYGTALTHSSSYPASAAPNFGVNPEIVETSKALATGAATDPDAIFDFVHNLVGTEFAFGLRKGALGALIDRSGTPFDQNALFLALVRQAGYTARYRIGRATLTPTQIALWTGVSDIHAVCQLLANGGIPVAFNGATGSTTSCPLSGSTFTSVTILHVWSQVLISGAWYSYDPSFKTYTSPTAVPIFSTAGLVSGQAAVTANATLSSQSGVSKLSNVDTSDLDQYLKHAGGTLLNQLQAHDAALDTDTVLGSGKIIQTYAPFGGYRNSSPAGYTSTPDLLINNELPNQYRTKLTVSLYTDGGVAFTQALYADEIYGRRLSIDSTFTAAGQPSALSATYAPLTFSLSVDDVPIVQYQCTDGSASCIPGGTGTIRGSDPNGQLTLAVDHPYVAGGGTYADQTIVRQVALSVPVTIVAAFGSVSPALATKWSNERVDDQILPTGETAPYQCSNAREMDLCTELYDGPVGDFTRQKLAASWLAQMSRILDLQAAVGQAVADHQHSIGVVDWRYHLQFWQTHPNTQTMTYPSHFGIGDQYTDLNIDTAVTVTSKINSQAQTNAIARAFAVSSAALEGSVIEQSQDLPDTASTASRFAWGNSPDEDPCFTTITPRPFFSFIPSTSQSTRQSLYTYDGEPLNADCMPVPAIAGPSPSDLANQYDLTIGQYLTAGFGVTTSAEIFLGPGARFGDPIPGSNVATSNPTHQRGGALVATLYDASGNVSQVAHTLVNPDGVSKGGGGEQPSQFAEYDPSKAADVLKDRFVDRSVALGVDLKTGTIGYSTPTLLSIGNGSAPTGLDFKLSYKNASSGCTGDFGPCTNPVQGGFSHSWDIRFSLSGSGLEAMGSTSPFAAAGTLVAVAAMQDLFQEADRSDLEKDVDGAMIADWWRQQMVGNTATISRGFAASQYVRLVDNSWMAPIGSPGTLTQTNSRIKVRDPCRMPQSDGYAYSTSRRWDSVDQTTVSFKLVQANGEALSFAPWKWNYNPDNRCEIAYGWQPTSWSFPQGPKLSFTYDYAAGVTGVTTSPFGRAMSFSRTGYPSLAQASASGLTVGMQTPTSIVDAAGDVWNYQLNAPIARSATARPIPYQQLARVYEPVSAVLPALAYTYDTLGRVSTAADAISLQWKNRNPYTFRIADAGRAMRIDPLGGDYQIVFDENGDPAIVNDELGRFYTASFDGRHRVVTRTYPEGDQDQFGYDASDNVVSLTKIPKPGSTLASLTITATYNGAWNKLASITDAMGHTTNLSYGANGTPSAGLLIQAQRPAVGGVRPSFTYAYASDNSGDLTQEVDPTGVTTTHGYDTAGDLISTTVGAAAVGSYPALGLQTVYTPDGIGNVVAVQDPLGDVVATQYDAMRRKTGEQSHQGSGSSLNLAAKQWTYDANGRQLTEQRAAGFQSSAPYFATGWQVWSTAYTPTGKVASSTDPLGDMTLTHYDQLDRSFQVIDPDALVSETDYDAAGQVVAEKRGLGTPLYQVYAAYAWSGDGNKLSVTDANANTIALGYDGFNRLVSTTFPDATAEQAAYDPNGELTIWTNRGGFSVVRCYDVLGRKTAEKGITGATNAGSCPTGGTANTSARVWDISNAAFGYDLAGRMISAGNANWGDTWAYDAAGRLSSLADAFGTLSDSYDLGSNLTGQTYGNGFMAGWSYDALHRVSGATYKRTGDPSPLNAATLAYDALSRRTSVTFGDTSTQTYGYDGADRVISIAHDFPNATSGDVTYGYGYDAAGRDISRSVSNAAYKLSPSNSATAYAAANSLNQYPSVGGQAYSYWREGPLQGDGTATHYYDELNAQVDAAVGGGSSSLSWTRDALGAQVYGGKVGPASTTSTAYGRDGQRSEAIIERIAVTPAGASQPSVSGDRNFVLGPEPDERLAFADTDGLVYFPHTDRQGSTIALSRARQAQSQWAYGPYGETPDAVTTAPGAASYGYRYTGQRYDSDFALYDYKARTYNPALGRFLQPDPAGLDQGPNLYGYVSNDPLGGSDPTGMLDCRQSNCDAGGSFDADNTTGGNAPAGGLSSNFGNNGTIEGTSSVSAAHGSFQVAAAGPHEVPAAAEGDAVASGEARAVGEGKAAGEAERSQPGGSFDPEKGAEAVGNLVAEVIDTITGRSSHAELRRQQAASGDAHRQVGDPNRVVGEGRPLRDNETGYTIYVKGSRVVIVDQKGIERSRYNITRSNLQDKIRSGRWSPR